MHPYINVWGISVPSYGLCVVIGLCGFAAFAACGLLPVEKKSAAVTVKTFAVSAVSFLVMILSALAFNSVFHSLAEGRVIIGGITWEGGVIGGFSAFLVLSHLIIKQERGRETELLSLLIPGIVFAHGVGRIGCFLAGCCFGRLTESRVGAVFPTGSPAYEMYPNTITGEGSFPVIPTQLFEAGFEIGLLLVMLALYKRIKQDNLSVYLICYGVFRFVLEFWRGDERGATRVLLTPSQLMSLVLVTAGAFIFLYRRGRIFLRLKTKCELRRGKYPENANVDGVEDALSEAEK